jgi:hypothetical protein
LNVKPWNKTKASKRRKGRTTTTTTTIPKKRLEIPGQEVKKMKTAVVASSIARIGAFTAHMLWLSVFFEQQDLADPTVGRTIDRHTERQRQYTF